MTILTTYSTNVNPNACTFIWPFMTMQVREKKAECLLTLMEELYDKNGNTKFKSHFATHVSTMKAWCNQRYDVEHAVDRAKHILYKLQDL